MRLTPSREFLDLLLSSHQPGEAEILQLVADVPGENGYVDYKAGVGLRKDSKGMAAYVREYASAFGNAEGGFLLIGYDQAQRIFDGGEGPGTATLTDWATTVLASTGPYFAPPPTIREARVAGVNILLIAFPRAPGLVPVSESNEIVHYMRLGNSNIRLPSHLVADIVLGRRQRPMLGVELLDIKPSPRSHLGPDGAVEGVEIRVRVAVENLGLVTAEDVRLGLATWRFQPRGSRVVTTQSEEHELRALPKSLLTSVALEPAPVYRRPMGGEWIATLASLWGEPAPSASDRVPERLGAFDRLERRFRQFALPLLPYVPPEPPLSADPSKIVADTGHVTVHAALYVIARHIAPEWYQLTFDYLPLYAGNRPGPESVTVQAHTLTRVAPGERPLVAVRFGPPT